MNNAELTPYSLNTGLEELLHNNYDSWIDEGREGSVLDELDSRITLLNTDSSYAKQLTKVAHNILQSNPKVYDEHPRGVVLLKKVVQFSEEGVLMVGDSWNLVGTYYKDVVKKSFSLLTLEQHFYAHALELCADIYSRTEDVSYLEKGLVLTEKALELAQYVDKSRIPGLRKSLGYFKDQLGVRNNSSELLFSALDDFNFALNYFDDVGAPTVRDYCLDMISDTYFHLFNITGDYDYLEDSHSRLVELSNLTENVSIQARSYLRMGDIAFKISEVRKPNFWKHEEFVAYTNYIELAEENPEAVIPETVNRARRILIELQNFVDHYSSKKRKRFKSKCIRFDPHKFRDMGFEEAVMEWSSKSNK